DGTRKFFGHDEMRRRQKRYQVSDDGKHDRQGAQPQLIVRRGLREKLRDAPRFNRDQPAKREGRNNQKRAMTFQDFANINGASRRTICGGNTWRGGHSSRPIISAKRDEKKMAARALFFALLQNKPPTRQN